MTIGKGRDDDGMVDELTEEEEALIKGEDLNSEIEIPEIREEDLVDADDYTKEEAEPATETDVEDTGADEVSEDEPVEKGKVPHGAMHQAREKYKAEKNLREKAEQESIEMRRQMAVVDERLRLMQAAMQVDPTVPKNAQGEAQPVQQQNPLGELPDKHKEPFKYMQAIEDKLTSLVERGEMTERQAQEAHQEQQMRQQAGEWFRKDAESLMTYQDEEGNAPYQDFLYAYQYLINTRNAELETLGYADEAARAQIMRDEEFAIVQNAAQNQQSPSHVLYSLAQMRGYQFDPAWVAEQDAAIRGEAPPAQQQADTPASRIKRMNAAKETNASLGDVSGSSGDPVLTAEMLADMDEDEFDRVVSKMTAKQQKLYFGG